MKTKSWSIRQLAGSDYVIRVTLPDDRRILTFHRSLFVAVAKTIIRIFKMTYL